MGGVVNRRTAGCRRMHSRRQGCQSLAVASRVLHASCICSPLCRMNVVRFLDKSLCDQEWMATMSGAMRVPLCLGTSSAAVPRHPSRGGPRRSHCTSIGLTWPNFGQLRASVLRRLSRKHRYSRSGLHIIVRGATVLKSLFGFAL